MIRFADSESVSEIIQTDVLIDKFKSIKPIENISEKDSQQFWEDFFDSLEKLNDIDEKIFAEVYGRSEDEFTFDFDVNDSDVSELIKAFCPDMWDTLDETERKEIIAKLANTVGEKLGIECMPSIEFYEAEKCDCGAFCPDRNVICINSCNFDNPQEILDTVAHEVRHAYQFQRAQNPKEEIDYLYAYNFENYITPYVTDGGYVNFTDYQDQLIEAEARAFANLFNVEVA